MTDPSVPVPLTWASHPDHGMRLKLAEYLGRGWTIDELSERHAIVSRPKNWTRPAWLFLVPLLVLNAFRTDRVDRRRLDVVAEGVVLDQRL